MPTERDVLERLVARPEFRGDVDAARRRGDRIRRTRRLVVAGACAVVLLAVGGTALAIADASDDNSQVDVVDEPSTTAAPTTVAPTSTTAVASPASDGWSQLPPSPLSPRTHPAMVAADAELIVWGGLGDHRDGAAYDFATGRWRRIADAPIELSGANDTQPPAVFTGREMLVVSGPLHLDGTGAAAYDPATDRWRMLATPPFDMREGMYTAWTGDEAIFYGGVAGDVVPDRSGYAYDPTTDTWREIPESPLGHRAGPGVVWHDGELYVVGGSAQRSSGEPYDPQPDGAAYDPRTDSWRSLPDDPFGNPRAAYSIDGGIVVFDDRCDNQCTSAALLDTRDSWIEIPQGPPLAPRSVTTTRFGLLGWTVTGGAAIGPGVDTWRTLAPPPADLGTVVATAATGDDVFLDSMAGIWRYSLTGAQEPVAVDEGTAMEAARLLSFVAHQRDDDAFEALPLGETVQFYDGDQPVVVRTADDLRSVDGWTATVGDGGSLLDLLDSSDALGNSLDRDAPCHDAPADPPGTAGRARVTIHRIDAPGCEDWFAVDLYLDAAGRIVVVRLDGSSR
jgi:hypothetical protein